MKRRAQQGFTLIEIMIALVVATLLVAMIIGIFTSMSAAYRTQQQVAELQQVLQAAEVTVEGDLRQAGFRCAQGFTWAGGAVNGSTPVLVPALSITDGGGGAQQPDQLAIFYGDPSSQAQVTVSLPSIGMSLTSVTVDAVDPTWQQGDLVLLTSLSGSLSLPTPELVRPPEEPAIGDTTDGGANIPTFAACVLQIASINGNVINFSTSAPWGSATNGHCTYALASFAGPPGTPGSPPATPDQQKGVSYYQNGAMLYKFVAHAYRIDPTRKNLSVFQQSPSGGLIANDWTDLGIGFTNFQVASRWYEYYGVDNADADTDLRRNWYSDAQQDAHSLLSAHYAQSTLDLVVPLQVSISFVVRTTRPVTDGTVTAATPVLGDTTGASDIGNALAVQLAGVADASRPTELQGNNIYRYATLKVDTRNLGIGR